MQIKKENSSLLPQHYSTKFPRFQNRANESVDERTNKQTKKKRIESKKRRGREMIHRQRNRGVQPWSRSASAEIVQSRPRIPVNRMSGVGGGKRQGPPFVSSSFRAHTAGHICSKPGSCPLSLLSRRIAPGKPPFSHHPLPSQPPPHHSPLKVSQQAVARVPSPLLERRIDRLLSSPLPKLERLEEKSAWHGAPRRENEEWRENVSTTVGV